MSDIDDLIAAMESLQSTQEMIKTMKSTEEALVGKSDRSLLPSKAMSAALTRLRSDNTRVSKILARLISDG